MCCFYFLIGVGGGEDKEKEEFQALWQKRLQRELEEAYLWAGSTCIILSLTEAKSDSLNPLLILR